MEVRADLKDRLRKTQTTGLSTFFTWEVNGISAGNCCVFDSHESYATAHLSFFPPFRQSANKVPFSSVFGRFNGFPYNLKHYFKWTI